MKALIAIGTAAIIAAVAATPAQAREGCGPGFHRAMNGMCVPNRGNRPVFIVGRYYSGRGYWYNGRWWRHRHRHLHGWRYY